LSVRIEQLAAAHPNVRALQAPSSAISPTMSLVLRHIARHL
jgi:hypothetical protein